VRPRGEAPEACPRSVQSRRSARQRANCGECEALKACFRSGEFGNEQTATLVSGKGRAVGAVSSATSEPRRLPGFKGVQSEWNVRQRADCGGCEASKAYDRSGVFGNEQIAEVASFKRRPIGAERSVTSEPKRLRSFKKRAVETARSATSEPTRLRGFKKAVQSRRCVRQRANRRGCEATMGVQSRQSVRQRAKCRGCEASKACSRDGPFGNERADAVARLQRRAVETERSATSGPTRLRGFKGCVVATVRSATSKP